MFVFVAVDACAAHRQEYQQKHQYLQVCHSALCSSKHVGCCVLFMLFCSCVQKMVIALRHVLAEINAGRVDDDGNACDAPEVVVELDNKEVAQRARLCFKREFDGVLCLFYSCITRVQSRLLRTCLSLH